MVTTLTINRYLISLSKAHHLPIYSFDHSGFFFSANAVMPTTVSINYFPKKKGYSPIF